MQLNELDNILVYHTKDDKIVIRNENKEINTNFEEECKGRQLIRVKSDNLKQEIRFAQACQNQTYIYNVKGDNLNVLKKVSHLNYQLNGNI